MTAQDPQTRTLAQHAEHVDRMSYGVSFGWDGEHTRTDADIAGLVWAYKAERAARVETEARVLELAAERQALLDAVFDRSVQDPKHAVEDSVARIAVLYKLDNRSLTALAHAKEAETRARQFQARVRELEAENARLREAAEDLGEAVRNAVRAEQYPELANALWEVGRRLSTPGTKLAELHAAVLEEAAERIETAAAGTWVSGEAASALLRRMRADILGVSRRGKPTSVTVEANDDLRAVQEEAAECGARSVTPAPRDKAEARVRELEAERDIARAEVEMLRGVGCNEDGDGPCGACLKCARADLAETRAPLARLREAAEQAVTASWDEDEDGSSWSKGRTVGPGRVVDAAAFDDLRAALSTPGPTLAELLVVHVRAFVRAGQPWPLDEERIARLLADARDLEAGHDPGRSTPPPVPAPAPASRSEALSPADETFYEAEDVAKGRPRG